MDKIVSQWETKALKEDGEFVGHASIIGNTDYGGDIVEAGAFKEIVTNAAGKSVVLWQHDTRAPVAVADFIPDAKGLKVVGRLILDDPFVKGVYAHLKAGSVSGMSFGYDVLPGGSEIDSKGRRHLKGLKVWEASIVTFGMNPKAGVEAIKSAETISTIREFEDFLRDVGKFSASQAKALASGGWGTLKKSRDGEDVVIDAKTLQADLGNIFSQFRR